MSENNEYDLKPAEQKKPAEEKKAEETIRAPRPGEPGWVPPTPIIEPADPPAPEEPALDYDSDNPSDPDVHKNKGLAILGYIFFVIPLVAAPHSRFARFHANQGLLLFILWFIALVLAVVMGVAWNVLAPHLETVWLVWAFFGCALHLIPLVLMIAAAALTIVGIVNAANGERKGLPVVGHLTLLK